MDIRYFENVSKEYTQKFINFFLINKYVSPNLYKDTEIVKLIKLEAEFMVNLMKELNRLRKSFNLKSTIDNSVIEKLGYPMGKDREVDAELRKDEVHLEKLIKSRYLTTLLANIYGIIYGDIEPIDTILKRLNTNFFSLKYIGSEPSLVGIFKTMLNVDVEVTCPEAGVIRVDLLGDSSSNIFSYIACSCIDNTDCDPPKIVVKTEKTPDKDKKLVDKTLYFDITVAGYEQSVYNFIRRYIPAGRIIQFFDKDKKEIFKEN